LEALKLATPAASSNTAQIELERTPPPCDRCRKDSRTIVEKLATLREPGGIYAQRRLHLSFCGHHYTVNEALLVLADWKLIADTRARLAADEAARRLGDLR
jgi:hypothetical protein